MRKVITQHCLQPSINYELERDRGKTGGRKDEPKGVYFGNHFSNRNGRPGPGHAWPGHSHHFEHVNLMNKDLVDHNEELRD